MDLSPDEALARAAALAPVLRERSAAANEARRIPAETIRDFIDSGLFRLLQPARYGGTLQDLETFARVVFELGRGCGSAAWVFSVLSNHQWLIGLFPDEAQHDVWGKDDTALCAAGIQPGGRISREAGGWRVGGTWNFCSGCDNVQWLIVMGLVGMEGSPPHPHVKLFLVPRSEWEIRDNWHVFGLRGTGSKQVVVRDNFVPEHRVLDFLDSREARTPGREVNPEPLYKLPAWSNFPLCLASPAVGAAWGAYDRFTGYVRTRTNVARGSVAQLATVQMRVAEAAAMIDTAEQLLRRDAREALAAAEAGRATDMALRMRSRRDFGYAVLMSCQAIEKLLRACGGAGVYSDFEIQRCYRDAYAAAGHIGNNWDSAATVFGRTTLGFEITDLVH